MIFFKMMNHGHGIKAFINASRKTELTVSELIEAAQNNDVCFIKKAYKKYGNALIDCRFMQDDSTLVHWAATGNSSKTLQYLKDIGFCFNVQTRNGDNPLHWAVYYSSVANQKFLREYFSYLDNQKNNYGLIPQKCMHPYESASDTEEEEIFLLTPSNSKNSKLSYS